MVSVKSSSREWLESANHIQHQMAAMTDPPYPIPPLLRAKMAWKYIGVGKTRFYELIDAGILETVKDGRMTYITQSSCDQYLLSLPARRLQENPPPRRARTVKKPGRK